MPKIWVDIGQGNGLVPYGITWTNVDSPLEGSNDIHLRTIPKDVPKPPLTQISFEITDIKLQCVKSSHFDSCENRLRVDFNNEYTLCKFFLSSDRFYQNTIMICFDNLVIGSLCTYVANNDSRIYRETISFWVILYYIYSYSPYSSIACDKRSFNRYLECRKKVPGVICDLPIYNAGKLR